MAKRTDCNWKAIKRTQRMFPMTDCCQNNGCGSTVGLQRHHVDGNNNNNWMGNVVILCAACHCAAEVKLKGNWGCIRGAKQ